jgi:hypothetical protein
MKPIYILSFIILSLFRLSELAHAVDVEKDPSANTGQWIVLMGGSFLDLSKVAKIEITDEASFFTPFSKQRTFSTPKGVDLTPLREFIANHHNWISVITHDKREAYTNLNHVVWFMSAHMPEDNRLFVGFTGYEGGPDLGTIVDPIIIDRVTRWVSTGIVKENLGRRR